MEATENRALEIKKRELPAKYISNLSKISALYVDNITSVRDIDVRLAINIYIYIQQYFTNHCDSIHFGFQN